MTVPLLAINHLAKMFQLEGYQVHAVQGVTVDLWQGECLAIVGESGSGKSTVANMILGVYPPTSGQISFKGQPLGAHRTKSQRRAIQLVQQNPFSSINPSRRIGATLKLPLDVHDIGTKGARMTRVEELLGEVGLPADYATRAPSTLSGGQCQRVAIARALASQPEMIVLDEPTSALDVLVQARVLILLNELRRKRNLTYVFITHDLAVVRNMADRVAVLKDGQLVELKSTHEIFNNPEHDYTRRLISASPVITEEERIMRNRLREGLAMEAVE
ncbi:MAG: ATP-binding cassette domain-containing protein [Rhodobacteraceae bacterium]|nr:ATP-binding cassette domain-containing protein [Paracoccaceae bacterium]